MKRSALVASIAIPLLAVGGVAAAVVASSSSPSPPQSASAAATAADTGGYPWATAACQTATVSGTLSNGTQGTVCPNDNWQVNGAIFNPATSYGYRNCTDYVAWKISQTEGVALPRAVGDASAWGIYSAAHGNPPTNTPQVGDIAWRPSGDHVAYVEAVSASGQTVTVSEYNEQYLQGHPTWGNGVYDERTGVAVSAFQYIHVGTPTASTPSTTPPAPSPTVTSPAPSTSTTLVGQEPLSYVSSATMTDANGDSATIKLSRGAIEAIPAQGLRNGEAQLGFGCQIDPQTDAAEPFQLILTNTTAGFATDPDFYAIEDVNQTDTAGGALPVPNYVNVQEASGNKQTCEAGSNGAAGEMAISSELNPNQSITVDGFILIHGYYSPAYPQGNPALINGPNFQPYSYFNGSEGAPLSNVVGMPTGPSGISNVYIPLNPTVTSCGTGQNGYAECPAS